MKKIISKKIIVSIILIILSILAIHSNVSLEKSYTPVYRGLIIGFALISLCGYFLNNYIYSAIVSATTISIGIYLKINHYKLPKIKNKDKMAEFKTEFISYIDFLKSNYLYIIIGAITVALIGVFLNKIINKLIKEYNPKELKKKNNTKINVYIAIFVALSVAINTLRIGSISFGGFPIIFSGFALGPMAGFIVGSIADVLGWIIRPSGPFNIAFTITSGLTGAIPVLIAMLLGDKNHKYKFWKVLTGIAIGQILTSVILVPLFIVWFTGAKNGIFYYVTKYFLKQIVSIPIYAFVFTSLYESITSAGVNLNK